MEVLTAVRVGRGWSQIRMAEEMGTGASQVCDVETGRRPDPQVSTVLRMIAALGLNVTLFINDPATGDTWTLRNSD
jgi:transcriptional regulator with XRE-family HTH domain